MPHWTNSARFTVNVPPVARPSSHSFVTRGWSAHLQFITLSSKLTPNVMDGRPHCNYNCNRGTGIVSPARRPRAHHRINPYPGDRRQNETEMFSDHDVTSPSIAAVSVQSTACSMLAMQQQKRLCRRFVDVSAVRRGCHTSSITCCYLSTGIFCTKLRVR